MELWNHVRVMVVTEGGTSCWDLPEFHRDLYKILDAKLDRDKLAVRLELRHDGKPLPGVMKLESETLAGNLLKTVQAFLKSTGEKTLEQLHNLDVTDDLLAK
jgi:hypothetical protein